MRLLRTDVAAVPGHRHVDALPVGKILADHGRRGGTLASPARTPPRPNALDANALVFSGR
ncbi:hypothetical protein ACWCPI_03405 [Streptomyces sp. NPDC001920]